ELGLVMVKASVEVPPGRIDEGVNDLTRVGGLATVSVAEAVLPVPPFVEVTLPVVLFFTPAVVPVTSTLTVQVPLAAMEPPLNVREVFPAAGVNVPPQEVLALGVAATCTPEGSESVNPTPVSDSALAEGLVMVKLSVVVPLTGIVVGLNDLVIEGGATTVMLAEAVLPVPPLPEVTLPLRLFLTPAVTPVTLTATMQVPLAAMVPLLKLRVVSPAFGANVPPQEALAPGVLATCNPAGSESVNPTPVRVVVVFALVIVKGSVVVPPSGMVGEPNPLLIEGGPTTVMVADAVLPV